MSVATVNGLHVNFMTSARYLSTNTTEVRSLAWKYHPCVGFSHNSWPGTDLKDDHWPKKATKAWTTKGRQCSQDFGQHDCHSKMSWQRGTQTSPRVKVLLRTTLHTPDTKQPRNRGVATVPASRRGQNKAYRGWAIPACEDRANCSGHPSHGRLLVEDADDALGGCQGHAVARVPCVGTHVGCDDAVGHAYQWVILGQGFWLCNIQPSRPDDVVLEGDVQVFMVDDPSTPRVDNDSCVLHPSGRDGIIEKHVNK